MKKQINEIKRMQQLSGIIKESQLNEYGMTSLEDKDIQDIKDIISLLRQAAEKADRVEMEDFAFKLRKDADDVEADLGNILGNMLSISESQLNENQGLFYIHDIEGMEEPIGPFDLSKASEELIKHGQGWAIMDEKTAKEIYSHLSDEEI